IDMSDLSKDWPAMRPAARRRAMRERLRGTDRSLFARVARQLGLGPRHPPPSARRVAARALALSAVVCRAYLEMSRADMPSESWEPQRAHLFARLQGLGIAPELEPPERAFLHVPVGGADPRLVTDAAWRGEGLAVLAWALNRFELPAHDEQAFPP